MASCPPSGLSGAAATTLFIMFNAHHERIHFLLPDEARHQWERLLDTSQKDWDAPYTVRKRIYRLTGRSVAMFVLAATERKKRS